MVKQMGRQMEKSMVLEPPWGAFNNDALCDQVVRPYRVTRESLLPSSLLDLRGTRDVINLGSIVERERDAKRRLWLVEYIGEDSPKLSYVLCVTFKNTR